MWKHLRNLKGRVKHSSDSCMQSKLRLQQCEPRHSLSAASIMGLSVMPQGGTNVLVSGFVMDERPASVQVQFSGAVNGQVTANSMGFFQFSQQAASLGTITAIAHDDEGFNSYPASAQLFSNVPAITGLTVTPTNNGKMVTVSGMVMDESPGNRPVTLSGAVNGTITTSAFGTFSATIEASSLGTVTATVTDVWGQTSSAAMATLMNSPPTIAGLTVVPTGNGKMVTISATVYDEAASGLSVQLSGVVSGAATTGSDGRISVTLQASNLGTVNARVTDIWGQTSNVASAMLSSMAPSVTVSGMEAGNGKYITVSGMVTGASPGGSTVTLGGVVSGTATTNAQGQYSVTLLASQLGQITATTTDIWGQTSNTATFTVASAPPTIVNFSACEGTNELWYFQGAVNDEKYYGLTVTFGGLLSGLTTTVGYTGLFSVSQQIVEGVFGTACAQVTDWWGQLSAQVQIGVDNTT